MTSLFDVGKSAIQAYRQSLAVTGQNIANMNTEGYMRREADLQEVTASQGGITSLANQAGLGVRVADIRRSFDEFLLLKKQIENDKKKFVTKSKTNCHFGLLFFLSFVSLSKNSVKPHFWMMNT